MWRTTNRQGSLQLIWLILTKRALVSAEPLTGIVSGPIFSSAGHVTLRCPRGRHLWLERGETSDLDTVLSN